MQAGSALFTAEPKGGIQVYSIGEFSQINRITTKTLRHYERIGLFRPSSVDQWTGYRYYSAEQLPEIVRILELKELGFSLREISLIIGSQEQTRTWLQKRISDLKQESRDLKEKIGKAQDWLLRLDGDKSSTAQPCLKALPEVLAATMRTTIASYDTFFDIVPRMGEYMNSVGAVCQEPAYCFTIYHDGEFRETDIDVEICEAVVASCADNERVQFKIIPGAETALCLMHRGPYTSLYRTYNALFGWIPANGYRQTGHPRESYIDGIWNFENSEDWLTEVQVPVERL
jgi:DNA-binding transcriptional MerR regulator